HRALQNQETQIDIATKSVDNARRTYEINLERYRNGDLPSKDIAFYQTQLSREQLNEVFARINYELALLDLKVRTLYDFARGEPLAPTVDGD
ncbi:MAG: TolC family protein, partial [Candidatus Latescibacterota bacterium]|nr:TolC family protein [Candidatus Latescibacterota bacterium]